MSGIPCCALWAKPERAHVLPSQARVPAGTIEVLSSLILLAIAGGTTSSLAHMFCHDCTLGHQTVCKTQVTVADDCSSHSKS